MKNLYELVQGLSSDLPLMPRPTGHHPLLFLSTLSLALTLMPSYLYALQFYPRTWQNKQNIENTHTNFKNQGVPIVVCWVRNPRWCP